MHIIDFEPHHLRLIVPQAWQRYDGHPAQPDPVGEAATAVHDGLPVACFGVQPIWPGRGYAWALLDEAAPPHLLSLTRVIRARLEMTAWRRVEMAVHAEFAQGARWARMLGFDLECTARAYLADGADAHIFVRIR